MSQKAQGWSWTNSVCPEVPVKLELADQAPAGSTHAHLRRRRRVLDRVVLGGTRSAEIDMPERGASRLGEMHDPTCGTV